MLTNKIINCIISCNNFDEARSIFIEFCQNDNITTEEKQKILDILQYKADDPRDICILIDFYKRFGTEEQLFKFISKCDYQDNIQVRTKIISICRKKGKEKEATYLIEKQPIDSISMVQEAANLNKLGQYKEARNIIEKVIMNRGIDKYDIKVYASIINNLTKNDDYANECLLPNIARDICKSIEVRSFDINLFLKRLFKYEDDFGNNNRAKVIQKIIKIYNG